jgi:hypothetical protein
MPAAITCRSLKKTDVTISASSTPGCSQRGYSSTQAPTKAAQRDDGLIYDKAKLWSTADIQNAGERLCGASKALVRHSVYKIKDLLIVKPGLENGCHLGSRQTKQHITISGEYRNHRELMDA